MSGGSFDYVFRNELDELADHQNRWNLMKMIGFLRVEEMDKAAEELEQFTRSLKAATSTGYWGMYEGTDSDNPCVGLEAWWSELKWFCKAIEWYCSGDTGKNHLETRWKDYQNSMESVKQKGGDE